MKSRKLTELTAYREREHISRQELARRLRVSRITVWRWEEGKQFPQEPYLGKIAGLVGATVPQLLGYETAA